MQRRKFLAYGLLALSEARFRSVWSGEPAKGRRIALVAFTISAAEMTEDGSHPIYGPFLRELRKLGYEEGRNLTVLRFSAEGDATRFDALVRSVVEAAPDAILALSAPLVQRLKSATTTIPIIGLMSDPLGNGIVSSISHPGGNITGISSNTGGEIVGKRLDILCEVVPTAVRIGFLFSDTSAGHALAKSLAEAASKKSVSIINVALRSYREPDYRSAFEALAGQQAQALMVAEAVENLAQRNLVVALANSAGLPAIYPFREFTQIGGLIAYAIDSNGDARRAASYADQILRGTKPGDIPIYQATKFDTIINLKTAKALGITISPMLLARTDEVIE
ncbi:ABC transporter substrate-binding protein [Bradyrhizobium sp. CCBAU 51745]|uniref:ABC transporter substrate-binding protein n=1 Tax=Bradyrhizobium sp. CCBAU 51745 TaxID=1325099 RepID=UPI0023067BB7|nr:ABC transporter substrate-binding protein [Bradyrhizobium sp. CCBAU 51745]